MTWPTPTEIRTFLDGYKVTASIVPDAWLTARMNNFIVPFIERVTRLTFDEETTYTEYLSGTGSTVLQLSRRNINSIVSVSYVVGSDTEASISVSGLELIGDQGLLKTIQVISEGTYNTTWRKGNRNIKVVYKAGTTTVPDTVKEAALYLASEQVLGYIGARTGGGSLSVQNFSRNFGERGRYQDLRNDLKRDAMFLLGKYKTSVVGSVGR